MGHARIGVAEYGLVSQDEPRLEQLVLRRGKYVVEQVLTPGDVLQPGRFPGLKVPLDGLFTLPRVR
jgi:Uma2 family endonuclease